MNRPITGLTSIQTDTHTPTNTRTHEDGRENSSRYPAWLLIKQFEFVKIEHVKQYNDNNRLSSQEAVLFSATDIQYFPFVVDSLATDCVNIRLPSEICFRWKNSYDVLFTAESESCQSEPDSKMIHYGSEWKLVRIWPPSHITDVWRTG